MRKIDTHKTKILVSKDSKPHAQKMNI